MTNLSDDQTPNEHVPKRAVLLLAKSAFAAAPHREMQSLAESLAERGGFDHVVHAFSEQGTPSLREALDDLLTRDIEEICILPLLLPLETSFPVWIRKSLTRWQSQASVPWPPVRIAPSIASSPQLTDLLHTLLQEETSVIPPAPAIVPVEGSIVPAQKRRVLVCQGGPCNTAGADVLWGHLRNLQHRRKLRETGDGMMSAKTTCLGPCNLAPVMQVYPEGTYYGGVTEHAIDRIVDEHLLEGRVVEDYAYAPDGRKQRLRLPVTRG